MVTQFFQTSSTLIVTSTIMIILSFSPYLNRVLRPMICFILALSIQVLIVIMNNVSFLAPIVEGALGKDLTFSNRTTIWRNAINHLSLFKGYGNLQSNEVADILGNYGNYIWKGATHAHNQLLNIGFQGGIILIVITLVVYYIAFWKLEVLWKNPISRVYSFGMFVYIIAGYTEVTNQLLLQLIVLLPLSIEETIVNTKYSEKKHKGLFFDEKF
ncbi:O-antigen ligase family protein [Streptococcus equinus]|uniref:O-antigen ligase family protein n=1 Tax=Streptococcus equinus TaxID=1335 RepID=UPI003B5C0A68